MGALTNERPRALLIIEDDMLIAGMVADQLTELGYLVAGPAYSLEDGKRLAIDAPIDGAMIDVNLGRGTLSSPIADILIERKIPFLFVTGYNEVPEVRFRHISVLPKPFTTDHLRRAVEKMLALAPLASKTD
jgi:two-component SAPR family response regulator